MPNLAFHVPHLLAGLRDTSGNPLNGGKVYTYAAGTTADKLTWTDSQKVTSETNPVILDSNGQALIFAHGYYKFIIKDANDVTLYTWDNLEYGGGVTDQAEAWDGQKTFNDGIITDTVDEKTTDNGVTVDGVKLKDGDVYADNIEERSAGAGVYIDGSGVRVKDGVVYTNAIEEITGSAGTTFNTNLKVAAGKQIEVDTIAEKTGANGVVIDGLTIKDGQIDNQLIATDLKDHAAGDVIFAKSDLEVSHGIGGMINRKEVQLAVGGEIRVKFSLKSSGGNTQGQIYKNGGAVGTLRITASGSYVEYSEDISGLVPGDLIQIYTDKDTSGTGYINNFRVYTTQETCYVPIITKETT